MHPEIFSNGRVTGTYPVGSFGRLCAVFRRWHAWYFGNSHVRHDLLSATQCFWHFSIVRRSKCKVPPRQSVVVACMLNKSCLDFESYYSINSLSRNALRFLRWPGKYVNKCVRHEERRLATRQIELSSRNGTTSVTPNFTAGMQTNCTNPKTYQYQPCFSPPSVLSLAVGGGFRYRTLAVEEKTIRTPVQTAPTNSTPLKMFEPKSYTYIFTKDGLEAHEGGGDVEDRIHRYRQSPVTHANHEDTLTNVDLKSMMDLHEWLTIGDTTRTHQGAEGPPRKLPSLPLFKLRYERALPGHVLVTYGIRKKTARQGLDQTGMVDGTFPNHLANPEVSARMDTLPDTHTTAVPFRLFEKLCRGCRALGGSLRLRAHCAVWGDSGCA